LQKTATNLNEILNEPRLVYFITALGITAEHPIFGLGVGGFALGRYGVTREENAGHYSHSTISETLSCNGIPGFLLYFGSRIALYKVLKRTQRLPLPERDRSVVDLLFSFFWSILLFDAVSMTFQHRLMWPLLGAACGYLWNLNRIYGQPAPLEGAY
jgi:O-antigen ligase